MPDTTALTVPKTGSDALRDGLAAAGILLPDTPWERLGGGRTNRVWKVGGGEKTLVVKRYQAGAESPLFPNCPEAEANALREFGPSGLAPRFHANADISGVKFVVYEYIPGRIWSSGTAEVALLLAQLHRTKPPCFLHVDSGGSTRLRSEILAILAECPSSEADALIARIPDIDIPPVEHPAPLHGDPVPGNIIRNGTSLTFVDWQCPRMGDPADDLAMFLSPAMQQLYRGQPLSDTEYHSFLDAYPDQSVVQRFRKLEPLFHLRMAAHCLWKATRGDGDYTNALPLEITALTSG